MFEMTMDNDATVKVRCVDGANTDLKQIYFGMKKDFSILKNKILQII